VEFTSAVDGDRCDNITAEQSDADQPMMPVPIISERHNSAVDTKTEADDKQNSDTLEQPDSSKDRQEFQRHTVDRGGATPA
jgi:hypothetical protein